MIAANASNIAIDKLLRLTRVMQNHFDLLVIINSVEDLPKRGCFRSFLFTLIIVQILSTALSNTTIWCVLSAFERCCFHPMNSFGRNMKELFALTLWSSGLWLTFSSTLQHDPWRYSVWGIVAVQTINRLLAFILIVTILVSISINGIGSLFNVS